MNVTQLPTVPVTGMGTEHHDGSFPDETPDLNANPRILAIETNGAAGWKSGQESSG